LRTGAVVLAAGRSSRMGENKLLLEVAGRTVLDRLLDALTPAIDDVVVVTGNNPEPIRRIAEAHGVRVVHNPNHEKGMTTSFQAGLRSMGVVDGVFLVLGDQLGLRPELLRRMATAMEETGALIVSPTHSGKRGHPVLFGWSLAGEILALDGTLKEVVDEHAGEQVNIEGGEWSTIDFDTPEDFEHAKRLFTRG
jgi:molybdenum cofactor cytidylyltransferase